MQLNLLNKSNLTEGKTVGQKVALILYKLAASWLPILEDLLHIYIYIYFFVSFVQKNNMFYRYEFN